MPVSALHKTNLALLKQEMRKHLEDYTRVSLSLPVNDESMSLLSRLYSRAYVRHVEYEGSTVNIVFESLPWVADRVRRWVKQLGGVFNA